MGKKGNRCNKGLQEKQGVTKRVTRGNRGDRGNAG